MIMGRPTKQMRKSAIKLIINKNSSNKSDKLKEQNITVINDRKFEKLKEDYESLSALI